MREIVIISGKGGTGKTSITAALASLAKNAVFADCDVDAADLHLILKPEIRQTHDFSGGKKAFIKSENCISCGRCMRMCKFDAIKYSVQHGFTVDSTACEGCKVCVEFCPVKAIEFDDCINGKWFISDTRFGTLVHAKLGIAEENSGRLVSLIRKEAKSIADEQKKDYVIIDGSPGIGCPVIASITGADLVIAITEPTVSAQHDLKRVIELTEHFKIPMFVCINKFDINLKKTKEIETFLSKKDITAPVKISYDNIFTEAQIAQKNVIEYSENDLTKQIELLWQYVTEFLERQPN